MPKAVWIVLVIALLCVHTVFSAPYTVIDTLGRSVSFKKMPERIVIAGRATLLLMDAVYLFPGVAQRVAGIGVADQGLGDFLPLIDKGAAGKPRFPTNVGPEQLAAVRPDLVILKSYLKEKLGDSLERIGIPVIYLDLESPDKFYADVQTLGTLFQQPERAHFIQDWYRARVDAVARAAAGAEKPSVLVVQYSARDGTNAFSTPPAGWIQTVLTETAGGMAAWKDAGPGDGWKKVGIEQLSAWKPRYVFVISYGAPSGPIAEDIRNSQTISGTIAGFPSDFYSWDQADTRWILGLEWMAVTLHPELFPRLDMREEVRDFFGRLYGIDEATLTREILPRLEGAFAPR